jgi:cyclohexanecarboxylate-CoA ligase
MASTPFLTDLAKNVADSGKAVPTLATFLCAGAPIPGPLVEQARAVLGTKIVSAWGMTENGAVTLILLDDDDERAFTTDGCPLPGVELKVVDVDGASLPPGQAGKLLVRSVLQLRRLPQAAAVERHRCGGLVRHRRPGLHDARGYIRITGRSKDVIIRGGENIPVVEIEALLYRHPAVAQVAWWPTPMSAWASAPAPWSCPRPARRIDLPEVVDFMKAQKVAVQYIPERLIVREAMPSTPSGKIQKFKLREMLRDGTA